MKLKSQIIKIDYDTFSKASDATSKSLHNNDLKYWDEMTRPVFSIVVFGCRERIHDEINHVYNTPLY